ncbi:MAG: single-stranded-DNA-specific exonuclease RecJ [Patescibacteria group bacterium]
MKKWVVKGSYGVNKSQSDASGIVSALLQNRGIGDDEKEEFLNPQSIAEYLKKMPADFKESLKKAREEILNTIKQKQPIIIHGDYDADGICATAILYKTLTQTLEYNKVAYFIPNRFDQGYGLSMESVGEMIKLTKERFGVSGGLVVTVDCGITAEDAVVQLAHEQGFKLLITDHHRKKESDPRVEVILWTDSMVGAGIALVLAVILGLSEDRLISLAGIATVTDLASLKGFNRVLVKKSLEILNSNPPQGIKSLITVSGRNNGEISVYDLGYVIGPRLNASGRLDSAYDSLKLLLEDNEADIVKIAQKLNAVNIERQEMTQKMYELAESLEISHLDKVIVVASSEFHEGVIGLVAGKLAQKYYKPVIVISINGEMAKGSARSVLGVNIIEMLRHFEDRFTGLGGHPMAAGFSIKKENLEQFTTDFIKYTQEAISEELLVPQLNIDLEIPLSLINANLFKEINKLKPYGIGNPEPLFLSRNVGVASSDFVGKGDSHLSLKLFDRQNMYKAILFDAKNLGVLGFDLGTKIDIVYTASSKEFNGKPSLDIIIKDYASSTPSTLYPSSS